MGYGQLDNDVTDQREENPELTNLREENRRLYELVERLIASQESEQGHRKAIEAELQEMKSSLVAQAAAERERHQTGAPSPDHDQDLQKLLEGLGDSLEARLSGKIDGLEGRIAALSEAQREVTGQASGDPDALANATWKMIAPLGEELERLSERVASLGERLTPAVDTDSTAESGAGETGATETSALETLLAELKQAQETLTASAGDVVAREREEMREILETRLSQVGKTMDELLARQDDTQSQTLTLLRGLVDSHIGRLSTEWASQIDGLKRAVDDLRLEQVSLLNAGSGPQESAAEMPDVNGAEQEAGDAPENVVSGDFGANQQTPDADSEDAEDADKVTPMSPNLRREMQAMEVLPESDEAQSDEAQSDEARLDEARSDETEDDDGREGFESDDLAEEDALLTEPADWRADAATDDNALDFTSDSANDSRTGGDEAVQSEADGDRREIDLRAYKDLRLSEGSADDGKETAKGNGKASGKSYENAPAEASLTRFVKLIRSRKRSTPS